MLHTIIPIYENELLYSWVARYYNFSGFLKFRDYNLFLFGRDLVANVDMNDSIYFFKKNFNNKTINKMSTAENIIKYMTLFPYYTMFMDKEDKQECMKKILTNGNKKSNREYLRYYGFYPRSKYQRFHICPKCAEEQIIEHGERYLILEQQIPENKACFKHRIMFNYYDIKKDNQHYDINNLNLNYTEKYKYSLSIENYYIRLAEFINYFIFNSDIINKENMLAILHKKFLENGYDLKDSDFIMHFFIASESSIIVYKIYEKYASYNKIIYMTMALFNNLNDFISYKTKLEQNGT